MTTLNVRTTTVSIHQGDDYDKLADLAHAVDVAANQVASMVQQVLTMRLGDGDDIAEAQEKLTQSRAAYNEFADEAEKRARKIVLNALPRKEWRKLRVAHPPRPDVEDDVERGFNYDSIGDDLVPPSVVLDASGFPSIADRDAFLDALADGDFEKLHSAAVELNTGSGFDPKARLSSTRSPNSDETSSSPERAG